MYYSYYQTSIGRLGIAQDDKGLTHITAGELPVEPDWKEEETSLLRRAREELDEYFAGNRKEFDLPLHPKGTEFQKKAWEVLTSIPYGSTISYGEEAKRMGCGSARPVGGANGRNPIMIVIPCHRVIGADGRLGGYSGGLHIKERLLELEGVSWRS